MNFFRSYLFRRIYHGVLMYVLLMLALSALFNGVADSGARARIDEDLVRILRSAGDMEPEAYQALRERTKADLIAREHLDEPWASRVLRQTANVLSFRFGQAATLSSPSGDRSVLALILEAIPNTILLFGTEAALVIILGSFLGLLAARRRNGFLDKTLSVMPSLLKGQPTWWIGMLAIMAFSYALPLFPSGGLRSVPAPRGLAGLADMLWHLALPLIVLVALNLWGFALEVRTVVADIFDSPWISSARARGLPERKILLVHVAAGARATLMTFAIIGLLQSLNGNILIEGIFGWPGLGSLYFAAVQQSDVPVLLGILSFQIFLNLLGYIGLDIAYRLFDPRVAQRDNP